MRWQKMKTEDFFRSMERNGETAIQRVLLGPNDQKGLIETGKEKKFPCPECGESCFKIEDLVRKKTVFSCLECGNVVEK